MAKIQCKKKLGNFGENITQKYLIKLGYNIVDTNYRFKKSEIDIIAIFENELIFLEVKYRTCIKFGYPEKFVSNRQIELYHIAANQYIKKINWRKNIRFDIISIITRNNKLEIDHIKDAF